MNSTKRRIQLVVLSTCCGSYCSDIYNTYYQFLTGNRPTTYVRSPCWTYYRTAKYGIIWSTCTVASRQCKSRSRVDISRVKLCDLWGQPLKSCKKTFYGIFVLFGPENNISKVGRNWTTDIIKYGRHLDKNTLCMCMTLETSHSEPL